MTDADRIARLEAEVAAQREQLAELRAALEPLAEISARERARLAERAREAEFAREQQRLEAAREERRRQERERRRAAIVEHEDPHTIEVLPHPDPHTVGHEVAIVLHGGRGDVVKLANPGMCRITIPAARLKEWRVRSNLEQLVAAREVIIRRASEQEVDEFIAARAREAIE